MNFLKLFSVMFIGVLSITFVGCKDEEPNYDNDKGTNPEQPEKDRQVIAGNTAFLSQINSSTEYGEAICKAFINTASLEKSQIALITGADLANAHKGSLLEFYNKGGLIVVSNPNSNTDNYLLEQLDGKYSPITDNIDAALFAFNNRDQFFIILNKGVEGVPQQEFTPTDEETLNSLIGKSDENESNIDDSELYTPEEDVFDDYDYYLKLEDFIEWVNDNYDAKGVKPKKKIRNYVARGASESYNPSADISHSYYEISYTMPVNLENKIDQAALSDPDILNCYTNITYNAQIYPLYLHSVETENSAAGDYYIVEGTITAHNGDVWTPKQFSHGGTNNRVVGYFMKDLNYKVELVNKEGKHLDCINFYREPMPTTTIQSTSYSKGFTADFNMALSGNYSKGSPEVGLDAGFNLSWSSTVEQTLDDVLTQRFTDDNKSVEYLYTVCNINSDRNWGDWNKKYPLLSRSDFSAPAAWIWKVANNKNDIGKGSKTSFSLRLTIAATYGTYNWWRGASWDYNKNFNVSPQTKIFPIAAPSRESFGVIALQNAGSLTVGNIIITNKNKEKVSIQGSINKSQTAKKKLKADTYTIQYDLIDPDADNKLISRWEIKDIKVKMGEDEESSTTTVSTVNAEKLKDY